MALESEWYSDYRVAERLCDCSNLRQAILAHSSHDINNVRAPIW